MLALSRTEPMLVTYKVSFLLPLDLTTYFLDLPLNMLLVFQTMYRIKKRDQGLEVRDAALEHGYGAP